jgi:hypothetical protein
MNWSDIARFHENYSRLMTETISDKLESVTIQNMLAQSKWFKEEFKERNKENSNEALHIAAEAGRARYVVKLIADNADVNEQGRTYPPPQFCPKRPIWRARSAPRRLLGRRQARNEVSAGEVTIRGYQSWRK